MSGTCPIFVDGIASGGSKEISVGDKNTAEECALLVRAWKMCCARAITGATWNADSDECFAVFAASEIVPDPLKVSKTCLFKG